MTDNTFFILPNGAAADELYLSVSGTPVLVSATEVAALRARVAELEAALAEKGEALQVYMWLADANAITLPRLNARVAELEAALVQETQVGADLRASWREAGHTAIADNQRVTELQAQLAKLEARLPRYLSYYRIALRTMQDGDPASFSDWSKAQS